jgi:hypothetical protein
VTIDDFKNLLALISSDRLALRGNEVQTVARLQAKLAQLIQPPSDVPKPTGECGNRETIPDPV